MKLVDMSGKRYGSVVAIAPVGVCSSRDAKWLFACDCGNSFSANGYPFRSGSRIDCPSCAANRSRLASISHGMTNTPEYEAWVGIKTRCTNPNTLSYKSYGGRGIRVCERWLISFDAFLSDMGARPSPTHSVERLDVNGDYSPANCTWATDIEQANNKRTTIKVDGVPLAYLARAADVKYKTLYKRVKRGRLAHDICGPQSITLSHDGIVDTISGWSKRTGIKASTITMRVNKYGWPVSRALTQGVVPCM